MSEADYKLALIRSTLAWWRHRMVLTVQRALSDRAAMERLVYEATVQMDTEAEAKACFAWGEIR